MAILRLAMAVILMPSITFLHYQAQVRLLLSMHWQPVRPDRNQDRNSRAGEAVVAMHAKVASPPKERGEKGACIGKTMWMFLNIAHILLKLCHLRIHSQDNYYMIINVE